MTETRPKILFRGGPIYPMNGPRLDQGALLAIDGVIHAIGPEKALDAAQAHGAAVVELAGRPLFPGFCDGHLHLIQAAEQHHALDFRGVDQLSVLQERLRQRVDQLEPTAWVVGFGWERQLLFNKQQPRLNLLDQVAPAHPVFLLSKDVHSAWLNSQGLSRLLALPILPAGCVIDRQGEAPTGLVFESIIELQQQLIPQQCAAEKYALLGPFVQHLYAQGITAVHDHELPADFQLLREYQCAAQRRVRVLCNLICKSPRELIAHREAFSATVKQWFCAGGAKLFLDGSLGSLTAAVSEPYQGTANHGLLNLDAQTLGLWLQAIAAVGTHGVFHVIGDRAAELVLQELGRVAWPARTPHRLEHAQLLSARIAAHYDLGQVIFSVQPSHLWGDRAIAEQHLSPGLAGTWAYAYRTMLDRGRGLIFGSDAPVEGVYPWPGIQAAVTRLARPGVTAWNPAQAITLMEAIRAHTQNPQQLHGHCFSSGVLSPGAPADLVVFNEDPFAVAARDPSQLREQMAADLTFLDGELVYER